MWIALIEEVKEHLVLARNGDDVLTNQLAAIDLLRCVTKLMIRNVLIERS